MSFKSLLVPIYLWLFQKGIFVPQGEADIKRCPSKNDSNSDYCASSSQQPAHGFPLTATHPPRSGWTRITSVNLSPKLGLSFSAVLRLPPRGAAVPGAGDVGAGRARGCGRLGWAWVTLGRGSGVSGAETAVAALTANWEVTETKCYQMLKLSQIYSEEDCETGRSTPPGCPA